mmetsp:Transcript_14740/g.2441  ORF Transcript_14740/g.2441 Transcript_14740/m.2441 type:complete len:109 (-) Transcript_14740:576-902(-)
MYDGVQSKSFCGSPEYMAPEMLKGKEHSRDIDYYHLGVLLFEMLVGAPPFYHDNIDIMHKNIVSKELILPNFMSAQCKDLLSRLLQKSPEDRLGFFGGIEAIKSHEWI